MQTKSKAPRRTSLGGGIYLRSDGQYEIGWRDSTGKQRWKAPFRTKALARDAHAEEIARRARGEKVAHDPRLTFAVAADAWLDQRVEGLRPATRSAYDCGLKHVLPVFGRRRLQDIDAGDIARYISMKEKEGLKAWTIKGHLTVFNGVFHFAARHLGFAGRNPVALLDRVERPNSDEDEKPKRILTEDEQRRLIAEIPEKYRLLFLLASRTGLRLSEALGLTWESVTLGTGDHLGALHLTHQLDRDGKRAPLKTKRSRRTLPLDPEVTAMLRAAHEGQPKHAFVFTTSAGTPHDQRNIGGRVMAAAVKRADLGKVMAGDLVLVHAPTFHSLRHTFASFLIAEGFDVEEVSRTLGHANPAITQRIYVHLFDQSKKREKMQAFLKDRFPAPVEAPVEAEDGTGLPQTQAVDAA
ncbi:MAG: integration/recombination/inversion protein [Conexibacter sp.]|nr:integration/recombination/inversion protein [Conexibacter sp.]